MSDYEKIDVYKGYKYAIYLDTRRGFRCGYVQIPEKHKLYEKFFGDIDLNSVALSYSGKLKQLDGYYLGWDHNHLWDGVDEDAIKKYHPDKYKEYIEEAWSYHEDYGKYYTLDDVIKECEDVIDELIRIDNMR